MANRSYIYGLKNDKHISMAEAPYKIPYAFRILAAYANRISDSDLFDKIVGIKADFKKGKDALYFLLDTLSATKQMVDHTEFEAAAATTKEFINAIDADEILLENGEIYALYFDDEGKLLDGPGLEKANEYAREDYQWIGEDIDNIRGLGIKPEQLFSLEDETLKEIFKWVTDLKDNWKEEFGLDTWRTILYYQFQEKDNM